MCVRDHTCDCHAHEHICPVAGCVESTSCVGIDCEDAAPCHRHTAARRCNGCGGWFPTDDPERWIGCEKCVEGGHV